MHSTRGRDVVTGEPRKHEAPAAAHGESRPIVIDLESGVTPLGATPTGPFAAFADATVMLVDDDPLCLEIVQVFLEEAGYRRFVATSDPSDAMRLAGQTRPDVLLLDLVMPGVSGFDVLAAIRADQQLRYTPVIMLSAEGHPEKKLRALDLGATDFLTKPVDPSELRLRLRNALAFKAYQDRLIDFDALTGLPYRHTFLRAAESLLTSAAQRGLRCALMHVNLDRFKQINDTLGHQSGDRVLGAVARRLERATPLPRPGLAADDAPTIARMNGDEFAVLAHGIASAEDARVVAEKLLAAFTEPFRVGDREIFVTPSVGIALYPDDAADGVTLLKHAATAMHQAKQLGENSFEFFDPQMNSEAMDRLTLASHLRRALQHGELLLHYQPKMSVQSGRLGGLEALIRWEHPELGSVSPEKFIPLAEQLGLIVDIDRWVLEEACRQVRAWQRDGLTIPNVSVNLSPAQFKQRRAMEAVRDALGRSGLAPHHLTLEVTERMLMDDAEASVAMLDELKAMGVKFSVDDFGTGYSSLSYLTRLPLDELKIDRSFLAGVPGNPKNTAILGTVIDLAKALKLKVVAEGVETEEQLAFLRASPCDEYQGFLHGRPLPPSACAALLRRSSG